MAPISITISIYITPSMFTVCCITVCLSAELFMQVLFGLRTSNIIDFGCKEHNMVAEEDCLFGENYEYKHKFVGMVHFLFL